MLRIANMETVSVKFLPSHFLYFIFISYFYLTVAIARVHVFKYFIYLVRSTLAIYFFTYSTRRNAKELRESIVEWKQGYRSSSRDLGRWYSGKIAVTGGWANGSRRSISILITLPRIFYDTCLLTESYRSTVYTLGRNVNFMYDLKIFSKSANLSLVISTSLFSLFISFYSSTCVLLFCWIFAILIIIQLYCNKI